MSEYDTLDLITSVFSRHTFAHSNKEDFQLQTKIFVIALFHSLADKMGDVQRQPIVEILQYYVRQIDAKLSQNQTYLANMGFIDTDEKMEYSNYEIMATKLDIEKFDYALNNGSPLDKTTLKILKEFLYVLYIAPFGRYDDEDYFDRYFSEFLKYEKIFLADYIITKSAINNLLNALSQ